MESKERKQDLHDKSPQPAEHDYNAHDENPGPSKEAIEEKDENGAGKVMKWMIPILVIALVLVYFLFFRNNVSQ